MSKITNEHSHEHKTNERGKRILCWGLCVTGPAKDQLGALAILLLVCCATASVSFFGYSELYNQEDTSVLLVTLYSTSVFFGLWAMVAHLCVMCSDPGILTQGAPSATDDYMMQCMDLDETERVVFEDDPVYQNSMYYQFRGCETCNLTRTPKASHCNQCGHCVQGWDHHCMALNNCVGIRNFRAFVTFLVVSFTFAIFMTVSCLCILLISRDYSDRNLFKIIGTVSGLLVGVTTFALTVKPWFKNTCRFMIALFGIILAMGLTMAFCRDMASIIAATAIYLAFGYTLIIKSMLSDYLDLVSRHLTTKEKKARQQCIKERCLPKDSDFKN